MVWGLSSISRSRESEEEPDYPRLYLPWCEILDVCLPLLDPKQFPFICRRCDASCDFSGRWQQYGCKDQE